MAAHSGGGQSKHVGELSSAGRAAFEQHPHDALAGGCLTLRVAACGPRSGRLELHNTSVPLLPTVHNRRAAIRPPSDARHKPRLVRCPLPLSSWTGLSLIHISEPTRRTPI